MSTELFGRDLHQFTNAENAMWLANRAIDHAEVVSDSLRNARCALADDMRGLPHDMCDSGELFYMAIEALEAQGLEVMQSDNGQYLWVQKPAELEREPGDSLEAALFNAAMDGIESLALALGAPLDSPAVKAAVEAVANNQ